MTDQNTYKIENTINSIQVPGMALRSNARLPASKSKFYKPYLIPTISNLRIVSMSPSDPQGSLDDSFHASSPRYDSSEECRDSYFFNIYL